jgi:MarR family transcriptional regulator, organic hydroperoxide resistance regulator
MARARRANGSLPERGTDETRDPRKFAKSGVLDFLGLLWTLNHAMLKRSKWMERTLGVTGPQRLVVRLVGRFPGVSAGELAGVFAFHPSTMTGILSRLTAGGVLVRDTDEHDRRRALLRLTSKGRRIDQRVQGTIEDAVRRALGRLSKKDLDATRRVLGTLVAELELPE